MRFAVFILALLLCTGSFSQAVGQSSQSDSGRDAEANESSSRDTRIDLAPPKDDAKNHPNSGVAISEADKPAPEAKGDDPNHAKSSSSDDVQEFHPWNPYRAGKDLEVGDFYFKRKNYRAALTRYEDALQWKDNDALANFRAAECYEKLQQPDDAIAHYQAYLKILPHGPLSHDAEKALSKLKASQQRSDSSR
jgi:tetratricopeptide (TPR) repeat protein